MNRPAVWLLLLAIVVPPPLAGQSASVVPGDRVRVWIVSEPQDSRQGRRVTGELTHWTADSLRLNVDRSPDVLALPLAAVRRLDMSLGPMSPGQSALRKGALGLLIGGVAGAVLGLAAGDDTDGFMLFTARDKAVIFGTMIGVPSAAVGALVGANRPGERWRSIGLSDRPRMDVLP